MLRDIVKVKMGTRSLSDKMPSLNSGRPECEESFDLEAHVKTEGVELKCDSLWVYEDA